MVAKAELNKGLHRAQNDKTACSMVTRESQNKCILLKVLLKLNCHSHNKNVGQSCQTMLAIKVLCMSDCCFNVN